MVVNAVTRETECPGKGSASWWDGPASVVDANGCDAEIRAVDALGRALPSIPAWARQVRDVMPRWGFEMCAHRWLEGLSDLLRMIGERAFSVSSAGRCGDVPGPVVALALGRAKAVESWLKYQPANDRVKLSVQGALGQHYLDKDVAAECYVDLMRASLASAGDASILPRTLARWRPLCEVNKGVAFMLGDQGLLGLLQNACGYRLLPGLDAAIRYVGDPEGTPVPKLGQCNRDLAHLWAEDPDRYRVTRGYLWGLYARLAGWDEDDLWEECPGCIGSATYALSQVSKSGALTPVDRWLVASLLVTTKIWCHRAIEMADAAAVPVWAYDLPQLV